MDSIQLDDTCMIHTYPEVHYVTHPHILKYITLRTNTVYFHCIISFATLDYRSIHQSISPLELIVYVAANTRHCECKDNKGTAPALLVIQET
jgi:hypothetical protein